MKSVDGISQKNLKKKCIAFDLEDVLAIGAMSGEIRQAKALELLEKLSLLEKNVPVFKLALVSGYSAGEGWKKLDATGFQKFFRPENVFFAEKDYVDSMGEVDRQRHLENLGKNPLFQDDYFKQKALAKLVEAGHLEKNEIVFVGHDLLTDAYYSQRFSRIHVALIKNALSLRHAKSKIIVKGLTYLALDWADFKKLLLGKKPEPDYSFLKRFIENYLSKELVGSMGLTAGLVGKAKLAAKNKSS